MTIHQSLAFKQMGTKIFLFGCIQWLLSFNLCNCFTAPPPDTMIRQQHYYKSNGDIIDDDFELPQIQLNDDVDVGGANDLPPVKAAVIVPGFMMGKAEFQPLADALTAKGIPSVVVPFPLWHWIPCLGGRSVRPLLERIDCTVRHLSAAEGDITKVPNDLFSIDKYNPMDCFHDFQTTPGGPLKVGGTYDPMDYPSVTPKGTFPKAGKPKSRVILIGHSAGGLVSRIYLSHRNYGGRSYGGSDLVHSIVTLGTPQGNAKGPAFKGVEWVNRERLPKKVRGLAIGGTGFLGEHSGKTIKQSYAFCCCKNTNGVDHDGDGVVPIASTLAFPGAEKMVFDNCHHFAWTEAFGGNLPDLADLYRKNPRWYGSEDVLDQWVSWIDRVDNQNSVSAASSTPPQAFEDEVQDMVDLRERKKALRKCGLYNSISEGKYNPEFDALLRSMEAVSYPAGATLFSQKDESDALYIVREGELECYKEERQRKDDGVVDMHEREIATVKRWGVAGERGVLLDQPRSLSVRASATGNVFLYKLSKKDVNRLIDAQERATITARLESEGNYRDFFDYQEKRRALSNCPIFLNLSEEEMENIAKSMKPKQVAKGDVLVKEGTIGESMYFVAQGSFSCFREDGTKGANNVVRTCNETDYFGELGAVFGKPRQVSVRAMTDATVWELHRDAFSDSHNRFSYNKYGAASYWLAPLGNALTKQNWTRKIVPRSLVARPFRYLYFQLRGFASRFANKKLLVEY